MFSRRLGRIVARLATRRTVTMGTGLCLAARPGFGFAQSLMDGEIDVRMAGARGYGQTNDTAAIQAAASLGLPLRFPATGAFFKISSPITLLKGQRVVGESAGSRIVQTGSGINASALTGFP